MNNTPLKIGLVLDSSLDLEDGVQQYVMSIGEWLRSRGHNVHYLVGQTEHRQLPNIHSLSRNIVLQFNGNRINFPMAAKRSRIRKLIAAEQFDILHVQTPHHPLMAQRVIKAAGPHTAIVATFHILPYGWLASLANRLLGFWLRPSLKRIDTMLAVSPAAAAFEKRTFGLDAQVLPNVFDYPRFHGASPLPQYADDVLTILFLGRLVPRKGCKTLLEAIAMLASQTDLPKYRVVICGRGPLEPELKQFVRAHRLESIVEFAGFVSDEDKPRYYASADIAAFPSYAGESFGIVLLEAMANGKTAVLAGDNPGYASVMQPQPELLFTAQDAEHLASKISELLRDQSKRQTFATWGETYSRTFDVEIVGQQLEALYQSLSAAKNMQ